MNAPLTVIAISLAVIAVAQIGVLVAVGLLLGRVLATLRELNEVQRNVAAAAGEIGHAAHQFGDLAGTTRNAAESLLGVLAFRRLVPKAGNGLSALKTGWDVATKLMALLRRRHGHETGTNA